MNTPGLTEGCPFKVTEKSKAAETVTIWSLYTLPPKLQELVKRQDRFIGSLVCFWHSKTFISLRLTGFARGYMEKAGGSRVVTIAQVFHSTRWNCAQPFQEQERHWQLHTDCAKGQQLPRYKSISNLGVMQLLRMRVLVSERDHEYLEIEKCIWTEPDVPSNLFSCWNTPMFESLTEQSIPIPHINVKQKQQNDFKQMTFPNSPREFSFFSSDRISDVD